MKNELKEPLGTVHAQFSYVISCYVRNTLHDPLECSFDLSGYKRSP